MKPLGIDMRLHGNAIVFGVTRSDRDTDAIWAVVEDALCAGWTVERFRNECAQAWAHEQAERAAADAKAWTVRP